MNNDIYAILPLILVYEEKHSSLSSKAILLYSLLLNRTKFSLKNKKFKDENGVFIYYSSSQIAKHLHCGISSAKKTLKELENAELVKIKFQEFGLPLKIYVNNISEGNKSTYSYPNKEKEVSFDVELAEKRAKEGIYDWGIKKNKRRKRNESFSSF